MNIAKHKFTSQLLQLTSNPISTKSTMSEETINWILQAYPRSFTGKHWCWPWKPFFLLSFGTLSGLKSPKLWERHVWVGMSVQLLEYACVLERAALWTELKTLFIFNGIWRVKQVYLGSSWITLRGVDKKKIIFLCQVISESSLKNKVFFHCRISQCLWKANMPCDTQR